LLLEVLEVPNINTFIKDLIKDFITKLETIKLIKDYYKDNILI